MVKLAHGTEMQTEDRQMDGEGKLEEPEWKDKATGAAD